MTPIVDELPGWLRPHLVRALALFDADKFPAVTLWEGRAGVGKRVVMRHLVAGIFCEQQVRPCLRCPGCSAVMNGDEDDVWWLEEDKFKIKDVEELQEFLSFQPARGEGSKKPRVVVVDFDKFNVQSSNRLLKTLEEPPENALILLSTSKIVKILPTIRSRVFSWMVKPPSLEQGLNWLALSTAGSAVDESALQEMLVLKGMAPFAVLESLTQEDKKSGTPQEVETWFRARSLTEILDSAEMVTKTYPTPVAELVEGWERRCNAYYKQVLGITEKSGMVPFDYISIRKMRSRVREIRKLACHANVAVNAQLAAEAIGLSKWVATEKDYDRA